MATTARAFLKPLRFRFTEPADIKKYGRSWHVYDESDWARRPARELTQYEAEIGIPLADVMTGVRQSSAFGDMAATWLALKLEGRDIPFEDYNPIVMTIDWEVRPEEDEVGKEEGSALASESGTEQTDTVSLPIMPPTE